MKCSNPLWFAPVAAVVVTMAAPAPADAALKCVTNKGYLAAVSEAALDEAMDYIAERDYDSLQMMISQNRVIMLKPGLTVYRTGSAGFLGSKVKFRLPGYQYEFWTVMEALKIK